MFFCVLVIVDLDLLLTSARLASDTPSLRSMSVPSDLQRGREEPLVLVALIRWAAMFRTAALPKLWFGFFIGYPEESFAVSILA